MFSSAIRRTEMKVVDLLAATPMSSGTRDQIRARLDEAASRGVTEIVFQPCGPDIRTELERFFDAATS
jgi:alkanesulfonate monooxygenase SsuD/methylene tetrahydromethanopterin reductase-like flavin-dependent oxidoreductase (luciferase family)